MITLHTTLTNQGCDSISKLYGVYPEDPAQNFITTIIPVLRVTVQ